MAQEETPEKQVAALERLGETVANRVETLYECLKGLKESGGDCQGIEPLIESINEIGRSFNRLRVGFCGKTGSGKTTLLNRLLGEDLLPTGSESAVTAALTEVHGWSQPGFLAEITFVEQLEWEDMVAEANREVAEQRKAQDFEPGAGVCMLQSALTAAWGVGHKHVKGNVESGFGWEGKRAIDDLLRPQHAQFIRDGFAFLEARDVGELKAGLEEFTSRSKPFWPIVFKIDVFGPFEFLNKCAFSLLDIPGTGDGDFYLARRYDLGVSMCDRMFFTVGFDMRPFTPQVARSCTGLSARQCSDFGVVVTSFEKFVSWGKWPKENPAEKFRSGINEFVSTNDLREQLAKTRVYCLESVTRSPYFDALFDDFRKEFLGPRMAWTSAQHHYVNEVNLQLSLLRSHIKGDPHIPALLEEYEVIGKLAREPTERSWVAGWESASVVVSQPDMPYHYTQLQMLLLNQGTHKHIDLFAKCVAAVLSPADVDSLLVLVAAQVTLLKERILQVQKLVEMDEFYEFVRSLPAPVLSSVTDAATAALRSRFGAQLPAMKADGRGCAAKMLQSFAAWWKANAVGVGQCIRETLASLAVEAVCVFKRQLVARIDRLAGALSVWVGADGASHQRPGISDKLCKALEPISVDVAARAPAKEKAGGAPAPLQQQSHTERLNEVVHKYSGVLSPLPSDLRFSPRTKIGDVYVLSNQQYKDGTYKIGETERTVDVRVNELSGATGVPMRFNVEHSWKTKDTLKFEKIMHQLFVKVRVCMRREFFVAPLPIIVEVGNIVSALIDTPAQSK